MSDFRAQAPSAKAARCTAFSFARERPENAENKQNENEQNAENKQNVEKKLNEQNDNKQDLDKQSGTIWASTGEEKLAVVIRRDRLKVDGSRVLLVSLFINKKQKLQINLDRFDDGQAKDVKKLMVQIAELYERKEVSLDGLASKRDDLLGDLGLAAPSISKRPASSRSSRARDPPVASEDDIAAVSEEIEPAPVPQTPEPKRRRVQELASESGFGEPSPAFLEHRFRDFA